MAVDRLGTDAQMIGNSAVRETTRNALQDLGLAPRESSGFGGTSENFLGTRSNNLASGGNVSQAVAQFGNRSGLEENPLSSTVDELLEKTGTGTSSDDHDPCLRAPAASFDHHFQAGRTRHDEVKQRAIRPVLLDSRDGLDTIPDDRDDFEIVHGFHGCARSLRRQRMIVGDQYRRRHRIESRNPTKAMLARMVVLVTALFLWNALAFATPASDRALEITGPVDTELVGAHFDYLMDDSHALSLADVIGEKAGEFKPIETVVPDFGYTHSMIWLRLVLTNGSPDTTQWRLFFQENFKQVFHVYVVGADGETKHPLAQDIDSPFSTRAIAFPELVVPLQTGPGETVTVFVRFWTEGSTNLPLSIETVESFTDIAAQRSAKNFVFYGMMLILIAIALLSMMVLRQSIFPAYIAYAASTLLYIMHSDGVAFQYLWPDYPLFNSVASVVTGSAYVVFGSVYARVFLNTPKHHPLIDKLLLGIISGTILLVLSAFVIDTSIVKKYLILVALFAVSVFTIAGLVAARTRFREVRFYVLAWLGAAASAAMMTSRHWFGIEISQEFQYDSMRAVMVIDAMLMGMAIIDRYNQLRRRHQKTLQTSLDHAQRNLDLANRLRDLEARYDLATQNSARRDRQFQNAVHDLRQPLHALRLAVHGAISNEPDRDASYSDINDSFNYLENLVTDHLDQSTAGDPNVPDCEDEIGDMSLNDVLRGVYEMFLADAADKGLTFTYVPTTADVPFEPLAVMRIVSNLVSNAIKYTADGRVLVGVRRIGDDVSIQIHDTGPGMTSGAFEEASRRSVRLTTEQMGADDGHGLGLDIVSELANRFGYGIRVLERRQSGAGIAVDIPAQISFDNEATRADAQAVA